MSKRPHPPNIAADPFASVLLLPAWPDADPSIGVLLRGDGTSIAVHRLPASNGVWELPAPSGIVTPSDVRAALKAIAGIRREASAEIDRLIALLDRISPDSDLEENGDNDADDSADEPSLGSIDNFIDQTKWAAGGFNTTHDVDREGEHDGREPDVDEELSMGWVNEGGQTSLASASNCDGEPSLGSFDRMMDQTKAWQTAGADAEQDPTEAVYQPTLSPAQSAELREQKAALQAELKPASRKCAPGEVRYVSYGELMVPIIGVVGGRPGSR